MESKFALHEPPLLSGKEVIKRSGVVWLPVGEHVDDKVAK